MYDWKLFWVITFFAIPGLALSLGGFIRAYWPYIRVHVKNPGKIPTLIIYSVKAIGITLSCIYAGVYLAPDINSRYIYFQALINEKNLMQAFMFEFLPGLGFGFISALIFLYGYYNLFRKHLPISTPDEKIVFSIEKNRNHLGLGVRIFFNAVVGEIIFRWGIQSLFVFIISRLVTNVTLAHVMGILITGFVYGFSHLLPFLVTSGKKNSAMKWITVGLYGGLSLVYGFLFWKFGIFSAMVAHIVLHIIWYPMDIFYYRKIPDDE